MSESELVCLWLGEPIPVPASGLVLTVVELQGLQRDCAPLASPVPPLKHAIDLVQIQPLPPTPRGCPRFAVVWAVRRIDD
jgi:hypothetical protein